MELRKRCIDQALLMLSEEGLKFKMSDLAKALGISKKTVYTVFESKEELLLAVADDCFGEIKASEKKILEDKSLSLLERIRRLIIVMPEQYTSLNWYRMEEVAEKYPLVYSHVRDCMENDWEPTIQLLEEGIASDVLKDFSLPVFKSMVEGCMEHFLTSPELNSQGISYIQALEEMMNILLMGIAGKAVQK